MARGARKLRSLEVLGLDAAPEWLHTLVSVSRDEHCTPKSRLPPYTTPSCCLTSNVTSRCTVGACVVARDTQEAMTEHMKVQP